ncbi:hypothetical protein ACFZDB_21045 [Streptomyces luteogriseus]|uniref:hypothetical protein n=1 Tax=Streptomyces TaxID=1883 RepID=UPI0018FE3F2A
METSSRSMPWVRRPAAKRSVSSALRPGDGQDDGLRRDGRDELIPGLLAALLDAAARQAVRLAG